MRFFSPLAVPLIVILGGITMLAALQRQLIYFPGRAGEETLLREAAQLDMQAWRDSNGSIIGWRAATPRGASRRMLAFHGNAGYALQRQYFVSGLHALGNEWEVFLFEYPGYGARPGEPAADSIKTAARQALATLLAADARPVYLLGESLGSGVASYLAGISPGQVAGLLLVTPFTTLADVAAHHYPWLPVRILLRERYDSIQALSGYPGPVAFLLAGKDEVVPTALGQQLHASFPGPSWLRIEPGAGHNSLPLHPGASWWKEVSDFLVQNKNPHAP